MKLTPRELFRNGFFIRAANQLVGFCVPKEFSVDNSIPEG